MKNILTSDPKKNGSEHFVIRAKHRSQETKKIVLPVLNGFEVVAVKDIVRLESDGNYTLFFFSNGKKMMLVSKSLCEYYGMLSAYDFCRVHDRHLVNLHRVKNYSRSDGGCVTLCDGSTVTVSRRKRDGFLQQLMEI